MTLSWSVTNEEGEAIRAIADRALTTAGLPKRTRLWWIMDIALAHCHGCPLDLDGLLKAGDFNFGHDLSGITAHLDRETGELTSRFLPRYSKRRAT